MIIGKVLVCTTSFGRLHLQENPASHTFLERDWAPQGRFVNYFQLSNSTLSRVIVLGLLGTSLDCDPTSLALELQLQLLPDVFICDVTLSTKGGTLLKRSTVQGREKAIYTIITLSV